MQVLTLEQAGYFAWLNSKKNKSLFATASIYDSFSNDDAAQNESTLQIYSLDIVNKTSSSQKLGTAKIDELQFTSLNWHSFGEDDRFPSGLIASGFHDGSVGIWDANAIIQGSAADNTTDIIGRGLLSLQNVHSVPVKTIAFNPNRKHLIASGGTEVAIHNLESDVADPDVFSPGDNLHEGSIITSVSWNRQVPHILGSASQNGISVVWDLKNNKSIFNFSDPSRNNIQNRNVSLSWNPEISTQVAVVYDDEKTPELQIWDLRNPKGPVFCSQKGHNKGIHHLDWCITDSSLIITTGRDNKVCVWNVKNSDSPLVSEFNIDETASDVQWSPRQPEIYSTTNSTGKSTIYSLSSQLDHIPMWLRPPVGARFSFDGRLAVFSDKGGLRVNEYTINPQEDELLPYIEDFAQNFKNPNINLKTFCENRINSDYLDEEEKEEWRFIKAASSGNPDDLIKAVGIDKEKILKQAEAYTNKTYTKKNQQASANKMMDFNSYSVPSQEEADDFFNNLAAQGNKKLETPKKNHTEDSEEGMVHETVTKNLNWNAGREKIIKENILIGNIEGAVDAALKCGRVAEAFLLAYSKGPDFFHGTFEAYVTSCNDYFVKNVIRYIVDDQISDLVEKYSLDEWKECVALCLSLTNGDEALFKEHIDELAIRFTKVNDHNNALLCYILSKNFARILETFAFRTESYQKGSIDHTVFLMRTVEKLTALKVLTNNLASNSIVDRFIYELNKVLVQYKKNDEILNLLTVNNSQGFECLILRDRLIGSSSAQPAGHSKHFPFRQEVVNIKQKKGKIDHNARPMTDHKPAVENRGGLQQQQQHHQGGPLLTPGKANLNKPGPGRPGIFSPPSHGGQVQGQGQETLPPTQKPMGMPGPGGARIGGPPAFGAGPKKEEPQALPPQRFNPPQTKPGGFEHPSQNDIPPPMTKASPFSQTTPPLSQQTSFNEPPQHEYQQAPPTQVNKGIPQQSKPQPPTFKNTSMPKPMPGPNRVVPGGIPQSFPGAPTTGPTHVQSPSLDQGSTLPKPTGPMGGAPMRSGPGALPRPGMMGNPPGFGGPKPMGGPTGVSPSPSQSFSGPQTGFGGPKPTGVSPGQSFSGPTGGNTFGGQPPMGSVGGQNKLPPQSFKPGMVPPNKGPAKFPPKPGMYGNPQ